ncbi:MAG: hypothetical protein ALECFALPRED_005408 [Alectoria fallacina]|uniref:G-protein coupled receptors family 2 profile 2 domain-containing protein n=1 Tax=Alectoria fallacina TaxID=1903189 RepID=A0A8H3IAK2_9LECA|nr:MAG: hypothetical protein ALECFALPRED_005408 [Alectoria fallacina]
MSHTLTPTELHDLETTERVASCFSLIGTSFILFTFLYSPAFRTPVNRLIFYASWGNTLCNVGTLMSQSGIRAGRDSHLCQFQGFLIQMFLPADALWNLAMAINVYMTLFRKYNAQQLKALEWRYHCMCYGVPFIVALIYVFIETPSRGKIYGPATLWCWIDIDWVALRIALCYAPAWCCILISFCIYVLAGREIFAKRKELRAFSNPSGPVPVQIENPFTGFKTTEIHITSELATLHSPNMSNVFFMPDKERLDKNDKRYDQYSVTIGSAPMSPRSEAPPPMTPRAHSTISQRNNKAAMEANRAAFGYTKVALLFFVSLLVTWVSSHTPPWNQAQVTHPAYQPFQVPSSINRVYSLIHPSLVSPRFTYGAGVVLPLMGFWNSIIYITTSWAAVRLLFNGKLNGNNGSVRRSSIGFNSRPSAGVRKWTGAESDSVRGLAVGQGSGYDQV